MKNNYVDEDNTLIFSASEMQTLFGVFADKIDLRITGIKVVLINGWAYYVQGSEVNDFAWPATFQLFKKMNTRENRITGL